MADTNINDAIEKVKTINNDPYSLLKGLPKPSLMQSLASGLQAGLAVPVDNYASPELGALRGISAGLTGYQQAQGRAIEAQDTALDNAPFEQTSPRLANEFQMLKGMRTKDAYSMLKTLSGYFSAQSKPQAKVFGPENLQDIITHLEKVKAYTPEDAAVVAQTLIGQPWTSLGSLPSKERAKRADIEYSNEFNEFGIPQVVGVDKITNTLRPVANKSAEDINKKLSAMAEGKQAIDTMYNEYYSLDEKLRKRLGQAFYGKIGNNKITEGQSPAFVEKIRNILTQKASKAGLTDDEGQRLDAFMATMSAYIPMVARGLGHTGVLTELDVIKSFGILPDPKGTMYATQERQRMVDNLYKGRVDTVAKSYRPIKGEKIDKKTMYQTLGISDGTSQSKSEDFSLEDFNKFTRGK